MSEAASLGSRRTCPALFANSQSAALRSRLLRRDVAATEYAEHVAMAWQNFWKSRPKERPAEWVATICGCSALSPKSA